MQRRPSQKSAILQQNNTLTQAERNLYIPVTSWEKNGPEKEGGGMINSTKEVMFSVLFVGQHNYAKTTRPMFVKLVGGV